MTEQAACPTYPPGFFDETPPFEFFRMSHAVCPSSKTALHNIGSAGISPAGILNQSSCQYPIMPARRWRSVQEDYYD
jgi:hypothetical protein